VGTPTTAYLLPLFSSPSSLTARLPLTGLLSMHQTRPQLFLHYTSQQRSPSIYLSLSPPSPHSSHCSTLLNQALLSITAPQPWSIVLLATPTNSANQPMAEQADHWSSEKKGGRQSDSQHSCPTTHAVHIKTGITSFDISRRKKQRLTAWPGGLVDWAFHRMQQAVFGPRLHQPQAATIHCSPPASLSRASRRYILACSQPDASSLDSSPALRRSQHCWVVRNSRHKTKHGILATALGDSTI
jgi:hypothetical protein